MLARLRVRLACTLVIAEHDGRKLKDSSLSAIATAGGLVESSTISMLLGGSGLALQELGIEQPKVQDFKGVPIAAPPRSSKLGKEALADLAKLPSLSSPVMKRMVALTVPLVPTSPKSWWLL